MILYLAGNPGHGKPGRERIQFLNSLKAPRMMSYFWVGPEGDFHYYLLEVIKEISDETLLHRRRDDRKE